MYVCMQVEGCRAIAALCGGEGWTSRLAERLGLCGMCELVARALREHGEEDRAVQVGREGRSWGARGAAFIVLIMTVGGSLLPRTRARLAG